MTKILLIEDEESVRKPLASSLAREGYEVLTAGSGSEAETQILGTPDLIVMDWMLPDTQGIELLKKWRGGGLTTPAILLTARTELIDKVLGLELGANDYMTKPFEVRELIARIRVQLRSTPLKNAVVDNKFIEITGIKLSENLREVSFQNEIVDLTKTEFDLLKLFLENPNQVFSREEVLKKVWGYENYPTTRTVDTHILQLRQKFGAELFETVHGIGYRFRVKS